MKKIFTFFTLVLSLNVLAVPLTDSTKKVAVRLTGRVDGLAFTDSYRSIENSGGIQYRFPMRPSYDAQGLDVNKDPSLRFGIAATRLGIGADSKLSDKVSVGGFVEIDFLGNFTNGVGALRLRHAYFNIDIKNSRILIGQTSHLMHVDELVPMIVTFGSGAPLNALTRPIQFRFSQQIKRWNLAAAVSMFPSLMAMQGAAMTPDISARVMYKAPSGSMFGIAGGFQSLAPRFEGMNKNARMNTGYVELFGRYSFCGGYSFSLMGAYGGNMQSLGMTGGFAQTLNGDGYSALNTVSGWAHFQTKRYAGFQAVIFGGYQKNMGSALEINKDKISMTAAEVGLDDFFKIAPSVWYHYKMLSFGLEYMYTQAVWAHNIDNYYRASTVLPATDNHRFTLLARFNF